MKRLLTILMALACMLQMRAQEVASDTLVSFVTVFPGQEIYELEGHSALRVTIGGSADIAVNFGLFDFNTPHFVYRFVKGETDYMVGAYPWRAFVQSYEGSGRRIVEQPLNLSAEAKKRLLDELAVQLLPPDNVYRYNYVLDNCATRPLSLVFKAAGIDSTALAAPVPELEGCSTFREVMSYYHRNYPWYQFGIDLALGPMIDRPITRLEQTFAPVSLMEALAGSPLAGEPRVLVSGPETGAADGPTPWWLSPMAVAVLVLLATVAVSFCGLRARRMFRGFDAVFFGILGLMGCVVAFLVFVSEHYATSPNFLLWWLNPFCLIPVVFIWTKSTLRIVFWYQIINFAVLIALIAAWPFCSQGANAAVWPLIAATLVRSATFIYGRKFDGKNSK